MAAPRKRSRKEVRAIVRKLAKKFTRVKIKLTPVESSNVRAVGYDPATKQLAVAFHSNPKPYRYVKVPKVKHTRLMKAKSKGKFINKFIKPAHDFIRPT
jgi:hypothetical protein